MLASNDVINVVEACPIKVYFGFEVECVTCIVGKRLKDSFKLSIDQRVIAVRAEPLDLLAISQRQF